MIEFLTLFLIGYMIGLSLTAPWSRPHGPKAPTHDAQCSPYEADPKQPTLQRSAPKLNPLKHGTDYPTRDRTGHPASSGDVRPRDDANRT